MSDASTVTQNGPAVGLDVIADRLLEADKVVVASHLNPDGDAIGSARAAGLLLEQLGKDVITYIPGAVVPHEYRFVAPETLVDTLPEDLAERLVLCVDCGNESRVVDQELLTGALTVINIDHHGDNTHFGELNHVRPAAACAAELVWELAGHLGIDAPSADVATAVYVGLVTDTGRFSYSNTTPESFELAATLMRAGVDVHEVFSTIFETVGFARTKLLGRALEHAMRSDDGSIVATHLTRDDFMDCGATEDDAEGVVDALRSVDGAHVAVFLRDLAPGGEYLRKGSLRTTREDLDVSMIARMWVGGGHRQAAGFNTDDDLVTVVERVEELIAQQLRDA